MRPTPFGVGNRGPTACPSSEAGDRLRLVLEDLEHEIELRHHEDAQGLLVGFEELHGRLPVGGSLVVRDENSQAGAVDVGHLLEVQQDLLPAVVKKVADVLAHSVRLARTERHASADVDDGHVAGGSQTWIHRTSILRPVASRRTARPARPHTPRIVPEKKTCLLLKRTVISVLTEINEQTSGFTESPWPPSIPSPRSSFSTGGKWGPAGG